MISDAAPQRMIFNIVNHMKRDLFVTLVMVYFLKFKHSTDRIKEGGPILSDIYIHSKPIHKQLPNITKLYRILNYTYFSNI